ncbi:MAG: PAS domain S-box protein [Elainella sp.]
MAISLKKRLDRQYLRMESKACRSLLSYGIAIAAPAVALLLTLWLEPLLNRTVGAFFYIAIILTTWYGGIRPGVTSIILSLLALNHYFIAPDKQLWETAPDDLLRLGIFAIVAILINLLSKNLRDSRRKVEQLSRRLQEESSDRLKVALEAAQMGMWDWDMLTGEIRWSPEHEQLFGLAPGQFDGRYETFDTCLYPADRQGLSEAVERSLKSRTPYQHEFRVVWADGSLHWIEGRGQAFYDDNGQPVRMSGTIMAIDDRKRLEQALLQSEQQFRAIFEAEPECVKVVTTDGILRNMNPAGLAMIEADSLDKVLGQCVCPLISPAHQQAFLGFTQQAAQGRTALLEFEITGLKGTRRWLESHAVPLQSDGHSEVLVLAVTRDITERKQSEAMLREQEAILRLFVQFAPASIAMFDREMRYVMASHRWIDEYSLGSVESVIGRSHYDIFPEMPDRWRQVHQRCLAGAIEKSDDDLFVRADGSQQWLSWEVRPWYTAADQIGGIIIFTVDITQSKQAEAALRQSEARLRLAQVASNSAVWDWNVSNNTLIWSPEYYQLYGLAPSTPAAYETWLDCLHPDDREKINQQTLQVLEDESSELRLEFRVVRAGEIRWFAGIGQIFRDEAGTPLRLLGITIDITERKQAELELQQLNAELEQRVAERTAELSATNDRLLKTLLEQQQTQLVLFEQAQLLDLALDTIMTCDLNSVITFWNVGAEHTYGWTKAEALGKESHTLLKTQFPQPLHELKATLFEQGYWEGELVHFDRHDRPLTVASRWVLQKDQQGKPIKILEINNDITVRKQAETALQHYAREIEDLYNNAPCGYHSLDQEGTFIRINDTELNWLGYSREEILYKKKFVDLLVPDSKPTFYENFPLFKQQGWINDLEFQIIHKDGKTRWVSLNATAIYDETGNFVMSRSTLFDVEERRKVDQMKQDFISVVSHELRTPLTSIRGSLGLVAGGVYDQKPEKKREMIAIAARQSDRLVRLVSDILDLRRLESGQARFLFQPCAAADLIQQSVDVMRPQAEQNHITLAVQPTQLEIWADADAIVQTLTNLLSNAIKFSPPGSTVQLSAQLVSPLSSPAPHSPAALPRCLPAPHVLFTVQDQGRGIPANQLETIFGQFQQVDASDAREKGGTGLGLAICRTIVEHHHGKIWVESILEQGSTFYFTLPLTAIDQNQD